MNRRISLLGIGLVVCYLLLFLQLNRVQVLEADDLNAHPENFRNIQRDFDRPRGLIVSADGVVLARTLAAPSDGFERLRTYPTDDLFAHIVGYISLEFGGTGIERTYNDLLSGQTPEQQFAELSDLFVDRDRTADVELTVRADLQAAAKEALGDQEGAVVLVDPRGGEVLAMWGFPSFDPNPLAGHDLEVAADTRRALLDDPAQPLVGRSFAERYFPGSSFKLVTAATGLETGLVTTTEPVYPVSRAYVPPASSTPITNFGGSGCGGPLPEILRVSCNTAFAQMGAETLGPDHMIDGAAGFGFNATPPLGLPSTVASTFPTDFGALIAGPGGPASTYEDSAKLAQASIGQNDVQATPLQMALVAAALAGDGSVPVPRLVAEVTGADGDVLEAGEPKAWRRAVSAEVAEQMRAAMTGVVEGGTASVLAMEGWTVGAKTGTAQITADLAGTNAWIVGFAGPDGAPPEVAFAVLVAADEEAGEQTGGGTAGPIARRVLEAVRSAPPIVPADAAASDEDDRPPGGG